MTMENRARIYLTVGLLLTSITTNGQYREQADEFLKNRVANVQEEQTLAILRAIEGDTDALDKVRSSRNAAYTAHENVEVAEIGDGLRLYRPRQPQDDELPLLVYLHGGGWTIGSLNSCAGFCAGLAATGSAAVLAVDYALAPEHPFPEGLNDCTKAVETALAYGRQWGCTGGVSVGGDSSGGNLAIATALRLKGRGIRSLVLFYPVTRAYPDGSQSWEDYGDGFGLDSRLMEAFNNAYTDEAHNKLVSVGDADDGDLASLPPTLLVAAERDILRDQGEAFASRLESLGVEVTREEIPGAVHLFITVPGQPSAFSRALQLTARFLR